MSIPSRLRAANRQIIAEFHSWARRRMHGLEMQRGHGWRGIGSSPDGDDVRLPRQPRYPRLGDPRRARRPEALRPHLSMGLPNGADYAQRANSRQGRTMQVQQ